MLLRSLDHAMNRSFDLSARLVLCLHVAGFAAGAAIILAVFAKADVIVPAAEPAVLGAGAAAFDLVALNADEILWHGRRLSRFGAAGNSAKGL